MKNWEKLIRDDLTAGRKVAIVVGLSAGKDSTATALLVKQRLPEHQYLVHYAFADTGAELPETYLYLDVLEKHFNKPIPKLTNKKGLLEEIIAKYGGFLPSDRARYCTRMSKIAPFRDFMDGLASTHDCVYNLVGIRADEPARVGYEPCGQYAHKVVTLMPLREEGVNEADVFKTVEETLGLPTYYKWRTRSGCYFCFYQRRIEWVHLKEQHPDLFERAKAMEKPDKNFTWIKDLPLSELEQKADAIKARYYKKIKKAKAAGKKLGLTDAQILEQVMQQEESDNVLGCSTCR